MAEHDLLVASGLGGIDGEYPFDWVEMTVNVASPEFLRVDEWHRIKQISGVRRGEAFDALVSLDGGFLLSIAAVLLTRARKRYDEQSLWQAHLDVGLAGDMPAITEGIPVLRFVLLDRSEVEDEQEIPFTQVESRRSTNGGGSSNSTSASSENDPSTTGQPNSEPSATFAPVTSPN